MYLPTLFYSFILQGTAELDRWSYPRPQIPTWYDRWITEQHVPVSRPIAVPPRQPADQTPTWPPLSTEELQESLDFASPWHPPRTRRSADRPNSIKVTALDCRHPNRVRSTKVSEACLQPPSHAPLASEQTAYILQRKTERERDAVRCRKLVSSTSEICGRWGHVKLLTPPRVLRPQILPKEACQQIVQSKLYVDDVGKSHPVSDLNSDLYLEHVLHGSLKYSLNDVRCTGEDGVRINGRVMNDVVVLTSTKLEIRTITVTVRGQVIEDEESGFLLTAECADQPSCMSGHDTYVFQTQVNKCPYSMVREEHFQVIEVLTAEDPHKAVKNDHHHLYLRLEGKGPPPSGCATAYRHQYQTDFKELVVVFRKDMDESKLLDRLNGRAVDLQLEERVIDSYNDHFISSQFRNLTAVMSQELCQVSRAAWMADTVSPWHPDSLLRVRGEVVQELTCTPTDVMVTLGDHLEQKCYAGALPVTKGGERLLMEARTRILLPPVSVMEVECSPLTSPIFEIEGQFLTADPQVRSVELTVSPLGLSSSWHTGPADDHSSYVTDLLYSREEIRSYNELIAHHPMKKHVVEQFAKEYCARSGQCGRYQPESGYFNMEHFSDPLTALDWWSELLANLQDIGQICSVLVVLYFVCSFIYTICHLIHLKFFKNYDMHAAVNVAVMPGRLLQDYARQVEDQRPRGGIQEKPKE